MNTEHHIVNNRTATYIVIGVVRRVAATNAVIGLETR